MKKSFGLVLSVILVMTVFLTGCGGSKASQSSTAATTQTPSPAPSATATPQEVVTLKFGTWNDPKVEQKKIQAFEATHPNIKIEIDKAVTWPWDEKLGAAAAAGALPDVFFVFNAPFDVTSGWLADMTPYLKADPDYKPENIFANLNATGEYNGKQYALPQQLFVQGVLINKDLFAKENVPVPSANWTLDQFAQIAKKLTKPNEHQFGVENVSGAREMLVPQFDPNLGWLTFDGKQFNFDKPAFSDAIHWQHNLIYNDKSSVDFYDRKTQDQWFGKDKSGFDVGKVAMRFDASWAFSNVSQNDKFNWDFLPIPGENGQRVPVVTDYIGMAKSTKHPKEAFEFIKWLTYSKDAWMQRITDIEKPITTMPLVNDRDVWDAYMKNTFVAPGLKDVIKLIPNGFVDGYKWLPGDAEIIDKVLNPYDSKQELLKLTVKPEDVAKDIQQKAMDIYNKTKTQIDAATK